MTEMDNDLMAGWRRRIGVISPTVLETIPRDFYALAPQGVDMVGITCMMGGWSDDQYTRALAQVGAAAGYLGKRGVDFIIHVGTPLVVSQEPDFGQQLVETIASAGSAPATTTIESAIAAFADLQLSSIALVSPFTPTLNEQLAAYIERRGVRIATIQPVETPSFEALNDITPQSIYQAVHLASRGAPQAEGYFLPCGQMRGVAVAPTVEAELGKPVLAQNAVDFWAAFNHLGLNDIRPGAGMLFERLRARLPRRTSLPRTDGDAPC
ncbi:hypothetical protein [Fodinicurvata sp. EGI_FJ10296]|uniref:maleate cis-trans isomerase family protein n=1 Tax=Fodinicurvata sp. EGI_FJ10296 TaxID=3231908 RepID=UPI0034541C1E